MKNLDNFVAYFSIATLIVGFSPIVTFGQNAGAASILDHDETAIAALVVNLDQLDSSWLVDQLGIESEEQRSSLGSILSASMTQLREAQVHDIFIFFPPILSNESFQQTKPYFVFPADTEQHATAIKQLVESDEFLAGLNSHGDCFVHGRLAIDGPQNLRRRLSAETSSSRSERLLQALKSENAAPLSLLIVPSAHHKKVLHDLATESTQDLATGINQLDWLRADIRDASSAINVRCAVAAGNDPDQKVAVFKKLVASLAGNIFGLEGLRVELAGTNNGAVDLVIESADDQTAVLSQILGNAVSSSFKSNVRNNLKRVGLAMHNFHDFYSSFPPNSSYSQDGKPLLSWRVHLLPFLEERTLYREFHLDEPWDSPHNSQLIHRVPAVFRSHHLDILLAGNTTIVVPNSEEAIFAGEAGTPIKEITDGTSNTILAIDAPKEQAVIWTKPVDIEVDWNQLKTQLIGDREGAESLFADASVRLVAVTIPEKTLKAIITRAGREVIEPF